MADLLRQRIFGLGLGYEDLIDHDALRFDPALMAALDCDVRLMRRACMILVGQVGDRALACTVRIF